MEESHSEVTRDNVDSSLTQEVPRSTGTRASHVRGSVIFPGCLEELYVTVKSHPLRMVCISATLKS